MGWRILYHVTSDAVVVLEVFPKKAPTTPKQVIQQARRRLQAYLKVTKEDE